MRVQTRTLVIEIGKEGNDARGSEGMRGEFFFYEIGGEEKALKETRNSELGTELVNVGGCCMTLASPITLPPPSAYSSEASIMSRGGGLTPPLKAAFLLNQYWRLYGDTGFRSLILSIYYLRPVAAPLIAEPIVVPSLVPISTKGSYVGANPDGTSIGINLGRRCQLFLDRVPDPVAIGMVYSAGLMVHRKPLLDGMSRVLVV
ncbi:hypothetical protein RJT34_15816 [Clitoria ternatea]|uniref:Uncharacterized protein n=1 Tax=Clitoria ternatea TaxID=43366 RepID=A0AAN9J6B4_CLITE